MGIKGLMTYMGQHSDVCLQSYCLHDTYLVIDGNSIASQVYIREVKGNGCFGGDYDKYAYGVSNFFDELLKCNVTPLIIIDGGSEDKKLSTIMRRTKDRVSAAYNLAPVRHSRTQLFPLMMKEVFKAVAVEKGIKCAQSLFEADDDIASVARILNCPVLSYDSDFYVFDAPYIPYNTMERGIYRNPNGSGYVKNCRVYKIEYFLQRFPGLDKTAMPLAATLLGNDYISIRTFGDFFSSLKLSKASKRRYNDQQRRIEAVFRWLQKQTLDTAVAQVLSKLDLRRRDKVLQVMEMIINGYLVSSPKMLVPLGFSSDFIQRSMQNIPNTPYKFQQDINNLQVQEEPKGEDESDLSCNEDDSPADQIDIVTPENESNLLKIAPQWFIEAFNSANFPSYFIDMLTRQLYVCPVQIEDFSHPTSINISLNIIRIIFKLLNAGSSNSNKLQYVARGNLKSIKTYELQCEDQIFSCKFPALATLPELPLTIRKQIIDNVLGVGINSLDAFPHEWKLYIATVKYWIDQADAQFSTNCHLYSLLFAMLYHVIDQTIGVHRSRTYFERKFSLEINMINYQRSNTQYPEIHSMPIGEALHHVSREDCLLAMPFFLDNFVIDERLLSNPKKFHISTVHAFSLFQNCLRHSIHLNALLGYPYLSVNVAEFFNGTLLYNLYNNFKTRHDLNAYVSTVLRQSPSLLQLFFSMLSSTQDLFTKALENNVNKGRRKKNRSSRHYRSQYPEDEASEDEDNFQSDTPFYDSNNRYAALCNPRYGY